MFYSYYIFLKIIKILIYYKSKKTFKIINNHTYYFVKIAMESIFNVNIRIGSNYKFKNFASYSLSSYIHQCSSQ